MSPSVAAVVVNFNSTPEIFGCIESIQEFVRPDFGVVVSNSADDLSVLARSVEKWSNWVVQFSGGNVGYGAAANIGATMVRATYLAILNPDIQMTDDAILRGVEYLERNRDTGIVGVRLADGEGRVSRTFSLSTGYLSVLRELGPTATRGLLSRVKRLVPKPIKHAVRRMYVYSRAHSNGESLGPVEVAAVSGACILARTAEFKYLGGFDEEFHLFWEDIDLCWRYRAAGFKVVFLDIGESVHRGSTSMARASRIARADTYRSFRVFTKKYADGWTLRGLSLPYVTWAYLAEFIARYVA